MCLGYTFNNNSGKSMNSGIETYSLEDRMPEKL